MNKELLNKEKWTKVAGTQCDLITLGIDQKVAYGDGQTFYYLIEPLLDK